MGRRGKGMSQVKSKHVLRTNVLLITVNLTQVVYVFSFDSPAWKPQHSLARCCGWTRAARRVICMYFSRVRAETLYAWGWSLSHSRKYSCIASASPLSWIHVASWGTHEACAVCKVFSHVSTSVWHRDFVSNLQALSKSILRCHDAIRKNGLRAACLAGWLLWFVICVPASCNSSRNV